LKNNDTITEITTIIDTASIIGEDYASSGLSVLIERKTEKNNEQILFDTGFDGDALLRNLNELDIEAEKIGNIFLSHGHLDHTGGLSTVLRRTEQKPRLFCNEKIFNKKILKRDAENKDIGITSGNDPDFIRANADIRLISDADEIFPGIWTLSDVPRIHPNEGISGTLEDVEILNEDGSYSLDEIQEDTSLIIEAAQDEILLVVGCGHSGIMNLIDRLTERFAGKRLVGIIGGLQLHDKSREHINMVVEAINNLDLMFFCPLHSTGPEAQEIFEKELADVFVKGGVGLQIVFS